MAGLSLILEKEPFEGILILEQFADLYGGSGGESGEGLDENELKSFLENNNSLTQLYVGNYTFAQMVANNLPIASPSRLGVIRVGANLSIDANGVLNATGGGEGGSAVWGSIAGTITDQSDLMAYLDWFEIVNPGQANEYVRVKLPLAGDYEIQAWTNGGSLPSTIWESMPLATSSAVGGIQLGAGNTRFLREDGTWQTVSTGGGGVSISGTPSAGQVALWASSSAIGGDPGFTYSYITGYLDAKGIYRGSGNNQHLTIRAGDAYGVAGYDGGDLILKAGNAILGDNTSTGGRLYLVPGNGYTNGTSSTIYLGDDAYNGNYINFSARGTQSNIGITFVSKGSGSINIQGSGQTSIQGSTLFLGSHSIYCGSSSTVYFQSNQSTTEGKALHIHGGDSVGGTGNYNGGSLHLYGGQGQGTGTRGSVYFGTGGVGYLSARTSETNIIYYDPSTGKVSYGSGFKTTNFTITEESGKLVFKYGSTVIASISSAGYFKAADEVEAFATP